MYLLLCRHPSDCSLWHLMEFTAEHDYFICASLEKYALHYKSNETKQTSAQAAFGSH